MNNIIRNLTIQNYNAFKFSFENTKEVFWSEEKKRLLHPGEYGSYRESLAKRWLSMYTPGKFDIGSGFIITSQGDISTQCDLIIYDKFTTPKIENIDNQRFFPIETVAGVGEIKSDIKTEGDLNSYLLKLSEIKRLRESIIDPQPYYRWGPQNTTFNTTEYSHDNVFTFLICNQFNFDISTYIPDYGVIEDRYKHNLVLSLRDGLLNYSAESPHGSGRYQGNFFLPFISNRSIRHHKLKNDQSEIPQSVLGFLSSFYQLLSLTTLLDVEIAHYLTDQLWDGN